jgi:diguanylate cyclase
VEELGRLCSELGAGLVDLSEDESWARSQCQALQSRLAVGMGARDVRAASELLAQTRERQRRVREERSAASRALKDLIQHLLGELGTVGEHAGRFGDSVGRHAEAIARADSLESLAGLVQTLLQESRTVGAQVRDSQQRLQQEHAQASQLEQRVRELESELRRLSDEVATDALTEVANRRGLQQAFDAEAARADRASSGAMGAAGAAGAVAATLAIGLIDIDNFKRLNDALGHAAGDQALKALAAAVRERLRPVDTVARFGGEEFVVLLPGTALDEAQQVLTRLQRELSASLFMHEGREVFVTFSAGVTAWRRGEDLQTALERADEALYEAKHSGKNRTCLG